MYALFLNDKRKPTFFFFIHAFFLCHTDVMLSGFGGGIEKIVVNFCVS